MGGAAALQVVKALAKFGVLIFRGRFNSSKCKTIAKMTTARIKLLRNKREVVVRQMRRDVAALLQDHHDATARVRVEHVIREQNIMAANEIIELFCDLLVGRISVIAKQRECPQDMKEAISSLIFAAPRCSDIPELSAMRDLFQKKYGKEFASAATDLRPNCGVNRMMIEKLSSKAPTGEVKLRVMKEIAKEYEIQWDSAESEMDLLRPEKELIDGPTKFVSASTMPVRPVEKLASCELMNDMTRSSINGDAMLNAALAAEVAAESARKAMAAAHVAANMVKGCVPQVSNMPEFDVDSSKSRTGHNILPQYLHKACASSQIKFDESDSDGENFSILERPPPALATPSFPGPGSQSRSLDSTNHCSSPLSTHPKMPDYESLTAHFEALKSRFSLP